MAKKPTTPEPQSPSPAPVPPAPLTDPPVDRTLQITIKQDAAVLVSQIISRWTQQGKRPSACTKSAVVDEAIRVLAGKEGLLP